VNNYSHYCQHVAGTSLRRHGDAPRRSSRDRNRMTWFECELCGEFKMIRVSAVKPGCVVSCGCKGRKQFINYYEAIAAKISLATRKAVYELAYEYRRGRRMYRHEVAQHFRLDRYVVDFLIVAHQRFLAEVAKLGRRSVALLSRVERQWLFRITSRLQQRKALAKRQAMLDAMHWREREAYLAAERARQAAQEQWWCDHYPGMSRMEALLAFADSNPDASIEIGV
jgi:hypothetical protein